MKTSDFARLAFTGLGLCLIGCSEPVAPENAADTLVDTNTEPAMPVPETAKALSDSTVSSADLINSALGRINAIDRAGPKIQSVLSLNPDAMAIAKVLDQERADGVVRGPFHGIPVLLKDNIETKDTMPTTAGSLALLDNNNDRDAPLAANLRASGAIILGKSNLSQWANFRSTDSVSGWSAVRGQTRNPHAVNRSPCGSSSGSGAAVAAGIVAAAIGTETNGSIICPSSMNGIVGFKPTVGVISQQYIVPISSSQDTAGPMTQTVTGAAMMMDALTANEGGYVNALTGLDPSKTKIGVLRFAVGDNPSIQKRFDEVTQIMEAQGFELIDIAEYEQPEDFWDKAFDVLKYEFKATLNDYLASTNAAVKTRSLSQLITFNTENSDTELSIFHQDIFEMSDALGGLDTPEYLDALTVIQKATRDNGLDHFKNTYGVDVVMNPSTQPAFLIDHIYGDEYPGGTGAGWIAAVAGYPHITVPMGTVKGLPVGLSFMGGAGDDKTVMAVGYAFEQASNMRVVPSYRNAVEDGGDGKILSIEAGAE